MRAWAWLWGALLCASAVAAQDSAAPDRLALQPEDRAALDAATRNLCGRRVALLGEGPTHGDGHTEAFKVALVQRLVERCGYRAIAFESGRYEFIAFDRARRAGTATPAMLDDAVGALWKYHREFAPLGRFLFARANDLRFAGLDFQFGGLGEPFANTRMIPELTEGLPPDQATRCRAAFARHVAWSYPADAPYGAAAQSAMLTCIAAMRAVVDGDRTTAPRLRRERQTMLDNLHGAFSTDFAPPADRSAAREAALYRNFLALRADLAPRTRIIVWGATTHLARDSAAIPGFDGFASLGARIHRLYGAQAFTLGFSARGGSYRFSRRMIPIVPPPAEAIERQGPGGPETLYLDRRRLRASGIRPGGALDHGYRAVDWSRIVDGMVVFAEEWPAHTTRPGY